MVATVIPPAVAAFLDGARIRCARAMLERQGCRHIVLSIWRPEFAGALDRARYDICSYHIADEYSFSDRERPIDEVERRLIERANQVFVRSPALMAKKGNINVNTTFVPNGVDYSMFSTRREEPRDLKPVPRPRIGYVGIIKRQLDFDLVSRLAHRHGDWSFVFVGPYGVLAEDEHLVRELGKMPNVFFLGPRDVTELPAYVQNVDVGILCYDTNDYTKYIYPLKLHEYLAAGRPVVSVPIPAVVDFAHVVSLARTVEEWSAALTAQLAPSASSARAIGARRAIARNYDWDRLVRATAEVVCARLGPEFVGRFESLYS